mgnify:CR=1 FL=1
MRMSAKLAVFTSVLALSLAACAPSKLAYGQVKSAMIDAGLSGENLTCAGLDWSAIRPGVQLSIGPDVLLEVTSYTSP